MVELSFYALSIIAMVMLVSLLKNYPREAILKFSLVGILWVSYIFVLSQTEVLKNFDLPPRVPLLIVLPAIAIIITVVNKNFMLKSLRETPIYVPILLQSFRIIVELLIYATYLRGIFPQRATFQGLNFDIVVGISAIFMSLAVYKNRIKLKSILSWNIASMCVLLLTVYSFISTFYFTDFNKSENALKFVEFPYLLLASVLLPIAIFLHVYSIKQVTQKIARS